MSSATGRRRERAGEAPSAPAAGSGADGDGEPDSHDIARRIVLQRLTQRSRSRAELARILHDRGCPDEVAATVLDRMAAVGLVDDAAYAGLVLRSRQGTKGWARSAVARDLRQRGVDDQVADAALAHLTEADELRRAHELVCRRLPGLAGLPVQVQTRRLSGMLTRRGYPSAVVYRVLRAALPGAGTVQTDHDD
ncbi:MAG TPA: regulatory protein RecX [Dermatophilaceae bacterium]|nr:regulatory protein RecX [Dermatophilaceae bacterium]